MKVGFLVNLKSTCACETHSQCDYVLFSLQIWSFVLVYHALHTINLGYRFFSSLFGYNLEYVIASALVLRLFPFLCGCHYLGVCFISLVSTSSSV